MNSSSSAHSLSPSCVSLVSASALHAPWGRDLVPRAMCMNGPYYLLADNSALEAGRVQVRSGTPQPIHPRGVSAQEWLGQSWGPAAPHKPYAEMRHLQVQVDD